MTHDSDPYFDQLVKERFPRKEKMTETKWTPGPWTIKRVGDESHIGIEKDFGDGRTWMSVARVYMNKLCGAKQSAGNARLISAAPEMAEALERLLRIPIDADYRGDSGELHDAIQLARAALSKAKGEA